MLDIKLESPWEINQEVLEDADGSPLEHIEAWVESKRKEVAGQAFELFLGQLPEGSSAEEEAQVSYDETFGGETTEYYTVAELEFAGKPAYGYDMECEDGTLMAYVFQEVRPGQLLFIIVAGKDDAQLQSVLRLLAGRLVIA